MSKATIIAEIGINFMGNMDLARKLIANAAEIGCDVAKFQYYSCDDLFGDSSKPTFRPDIYRLVKPFELNEQKIEQLMKYCDLENIEFGCSVFDFQRFNVLERLNVKSHKVASRVSKFDRPLAEAMLNTNKTCYVSTGFDAQHFDKQKYTNMKHLYCVAKYPTYNEDLNIPVEFGKDKTYQGFSSHATEPHPCLVALARGATVIEAHFTLDKSMVMFPGGFDHLASLNVSEMKQVVDFARKMEKLN